MIASHVSRRWFLSHARPCHMRGWVATWGRNIGAQNVQTAATAAACSSYFNPRLRVHNVNSVVWRWLVRATKRVGSWPHHQITWTIVIWRDKVILRGGCCSSLAPTSSSVWLFPEIVLFQRLISLLIILRVMIRTKLLTACIRILLVLLSSRLRWASAATVRTTCHMVLILLLLSLLVLELWTLARVRRCALNIIARSLIIVEHYFWIHIEYL